MAMKGTVNKLFIIILIIAAFIIVFSSLAILQLKNQIAFISKIVKDLNYLRFRSFFCKILISRALK